MVPHLLLVPNSCLTTIQPTSSNKGQLPRLPMAVMLLTLTPLSLTMDEGVAFCFAHLSFLPVREVLAFFCLRARPPVYVITLTPIWILDEKSGPRL